jgi:dihydropyrimidine dehydrogenase (NAD+) subunit PreA
VIAEIDHAKCVGCHLCYVACEDGAHQSIRLVNGGKVPEIVEEKCVGCNLCMLVCPIPGCITMKKVETGRPSQSWREYQEKLGRGIACEMPGERHPH